MRILNVTASYWPFLEFGGPPVKVRALAEGLAKHGHTVTVLTADWKLSSRITAEKDDSNAKQTPFGWSLEENGVRAIYLPTWLHYRALSWNPAVKRFCRARLKNFEIVHIFGLYDLLGPGVAAMCRGRELPYVVEPMGMFVPIVRSLRLKRMYHAIYGRQLFEGARAIIATSEQEADELAAGGVEREKIVLRRNGVEAPATWPERGTSRKALGIAEDANLVFFLGRLSAKKSPDLLLRSIAALPAQLDGKSVELLFVGPDEGGMKERLEEMADRLGVRSRVHFSGPLFGEAKWGAYRDADVFVLPSQNENFGNTAAEAAAAGTPVIVTEKCGIAPLLAGQAGLVIPHEERALTEAIARVLAEPALRERLAAGCEAVTERLGWEEPVRELEALYARVAARAEHGASARPME